MPLYLRKHGQEADKEKKEAIEREIARAAKRALLNSGQKAELKRTALAEMANLREVRRGIKKPPELPGEGYSEPTYDPTTCCWKSYVERDGNRDESQWKAWCVDSKSWLSSDEYARGKLFIPLRLSLSLVFLLTSLKRIHRTSRRIYTTRTRIRRSTGLHPCQASLSGEQRCSP